MKKWIQLLPIVLFFIGCKTTLTAPNETVESRTYFCLQTANGKFRERNLF